MTWGRTILMINREGSRMRQPWPILTELFCNHHGDSGFPAETDIITCTYNIFSKYEQ
jgi:hypothetical protein